MEEDELDPRIQVELEKLNTATDEINRLEIELDEANTTFRMLLGECTRRLKVHSSANGSAIVSARPFYEAQDAARQAQQDCQKAAVGFQRANEIHEAAKETVALAETRFLSQPDWRFDSAWQEMLNHATLKVRDAEKQRAAAAAAHGAATARYEDAQDKVRRLEQRLKRNVAKSRPYFEEKARCNDQLAAQKEAVESLQRCVANVKREYAGSLRRLEGISEEIHRKRADMAEVCPGIREPGVGAELEYRGELDRCDVQSQSSMALSVQSCGSMAYDGQSDGGSVRSDTLEGEGMVEGMVEGGGAEEIRTALVVTTVGLLAKKQEASTKKRQLEAYGPSDLEQDFHRAQIGISGKIQDSNAAASTINTGLTPEASTVHTDSRKAPSTVHTGLSPEASIIHTDYHTEATEFNKAAVSELEETSIAGDSNEGDLKAENSNPADDLTDGDLNRAAGFKELVSGEKDSNKACDSVGKDSEEMALKEAGDSKLQHSEASNKAFVSGSKDWMDSGAPESGDSGWKEGRPNEEGASGAQNYEETTAISQLGRGSEETGKTIQGADNKADRARSQPSLELASLN